MRQVWAKVRTALAWAPWCHSCGRCICGRHGPGGAGGVRAQGERCEKGWLIATWLSTERGSRLAGRALAACSFSSRSSKAFTILVPQPQCSIWIHRLTRAVQCRQETQPFRWWDSVIRDGKLVEYIFSVASRETVYFHLFPELKYCLQSQHLVQGGTWWWTNLVMLVFLEILFSFTPTAWSVWKLYEKKGAFYMVTRGLQFKQESSFSLFLLKHSRCV